MNTNGAWGVVDAIDPPDEAKGNEGEVSVVDEQDMPSSSRSMTALMQEAVAAMEKYPDVEGGVE